MEPRSLEGIERGLFCTLMCFCHVCNAEQETPHWNDPPWSGDVSAWAKAMAPNIQALGWSLANDEFNLVCPNCNPA